MTEGIFTRLSFLPVGICPIRRIRMAGENSNPQLVNELRNGLTVIVSHCEMLEDALSNQAPLLTHVKTIKKVALRMADRISRQPSPDADVAHQAIPKKRL
jgi:hypothetical protein